MQNCDLVNLLRWFYETRGFIRALDDVTNFQGLTKATQPSIFICILSFNYFFDDTFTAQANDKHKFI